MMKLFCIGILCFSAFAACGQPGPAGKQYLGTKTPYPVTRIIRNTPAPKGYQAVFINYVGRHGARFLTKPGSDVLVVNVLALADSNNALTATGRNIKQMARRFEEIEKGNYENITLSGADELQGIGNRMAQEYKSVFAGKGMDVYMTEKVRTQQSANAFLLAFKNYHQANIRRSIIPDSVDYMLRFYDLSPAYQDYKKSEFIKNRLDSLVNDKHTAEAVENVCKKIFRPAFAEKLLAKGVEAAGGKSKKVTATMFAESLYDLYCTQFLSHKEAAAKGYNIDFGSAFDESDLQWFDKLSNAEDFFEKGPATDASGIQAAIAAPLLADLLRTTDAVIQGTKHIDAVLRFTHAEAISPLATLLGIWQASVTSPSVFTFDKYWQAAGIIPMSANIQWILYYNGKDYLVKVLLNEQEAKLPLPAYAFPYYRLSDLQGWYKNVLQQAQQKW